MLIEPNRRRFGFFFFFNKFKNLNKKEKYLKKIKNKPVQNSIT